MITWNIDPTNYSREQLEAMMNLIDSMCIDTSIASEIYEYLNETYYQTN